MGSSDTSTREPEASQVSTGIRTPRTAPARNTTTIAGMTTPIATSTLATMNWVGLSAVTISWRNQPVERSLVIWLPALIAAPSAP